MTDGSLRVQLASRPDRQLLVAEVWRDDDMLAELSMETGQLVIEIYPLAAGGPWALDAGDLLQALNQAGEALRARYAV